MILVIGDPVGQGGRHCSARTGVGAAVSVVGWVLIGLAAWVVIAVVLALVVGHFVRPDRLTTLDLLRVREGTEVPAQATERPRRPASRE
jgi:hypothetical protein